MSQDPITAISSLGADPSTLAARHQDAAQAADLASLQLAPNAGGGASIYMPSLDTTPAPSALNLQSLAGQFSDGLQHGFYAKDINHLMTTLQQSHDPATGVTVGDVTVELLNVQAKVGIADAFSKVSSKLTEGLQTLVVKQG